MFKGTFTALVTPFRSGEIDFEAFEHLVEAQISSGVTGIVVVGTTGESPTLSYTEQERLIELTVGFVHGRCKVLAGTGSNSTRDTLVSTRRAEGCARMARW
jgi:4-hydroxy-tetrahydrodipicolinate synthase